MVAVLNSISQVIFSSFLMVDTIPKICYQKDQKNVRSLSCKVPVANVSGVSIVHCYMIMNALLVALAVHECLLKCT